MKYKLIYQIGDGLFTLVEALDWLMTEWFKIKAQTPEAKLISCEPEE